MKVIFKSSCPSVYASQNKILDPWEHSRMQRKSAEINSSALLQMEQEVT